MCSQAFLVVFAQQDMKKEALAFMDATERSRTYYASSTSLQTATKNAVTPIDAHERHCPWTQILLINLPERPRQVLVEPRQD